MRIFKDHLQLIKFETFIDTHFLCQRKGISDRKLKKYEQNKTKKKCSFIQLGSKRMQYIHIYNTRRGVGNTKEIAYITVKRTVAFTWR